MVVVVSMEVPRVMASFRDSASAMSATALPALATLAALAALAALVAISAAGEVDEGPFGFSHARC
jgi:hypothetical protein